MKRYLWIILAASLMESCQQAPEQAESAKSAKPSYMQEAPPPPASAPPEAIAQDKAVAPQVAATPAVRLLIYHA